MPFPIHWRKVGLGKIVSRDNHWYSHFRLAKPPNKC